MSARTGSNGADEHISNRLAILKRHGVSITDDVRHYVEKLEQPYIKYLQNPSSTPRPSDTWLSEGVENGMSNETIILGALSEMRFDVGTIVVNPHTAGRILSVARNESDNCDKVIEEIGVIFEQLTRILGDKSKLLIPICDNVEEHWGLVFVDASPGKIHWGDGLFVRPFGKAAPHTVVDVVKSIMQKVMPAQTWMIETGNYMRDVLEFEKQSDTHSSGFYVIATMLRFAQWYGGVSGWGYFKAIDEKQPSSAQITEYYRQDAVIALMNRTKSVYTDYYKLLSATKQSIPTTGPKLTHQDILVTISKKRLHYFSADVDAPLNQADATEREQMVRALACERDFDMGYRKALTKFCVPVLFVDDYMKWLAHKRHEFSWEHRRRKIDVTKMRVFRCFRSKYKCRVAWTARWNDDQAIWLVTKTGGLHNHPPRRPDSVIKRTPPAKHLASTSTASGSNVSSSTVGAVRSIRKTSART